MKFVKSDDLKLGMRLAKPIYNRDGVMLYERNSKLTRQGIVSIQNFGLIGVYILEPAEPVPPMSPDDIEFERFQAMAIFTIREILDAVTKQQEAKGMYQFANQIIRRYGSLNHKISFVQNLRSNEDYVYKHSLNTAILCALISHRMDMEFKQQLDIVVAALLHDVGSLMIPAHIYRKRKNEITPEDEKKIRTYHYAAIQLIDNDYDLDPEIKRCVRGVINDLHDTGNDKSLIPIGQLHADSRLQNIDTLDQCGNDLLIVAIIRVQQCAYRFDLGCRLFLKVHCRHGIVCIRRL